jgi:hypothetical protein
MQHSCTVEAVEWAAEHHAVGRAPGAVLGTRTVRALSTQPHPTEPAISPIFFTWPQTPLPLGRLPKVALWSKIVAYLTSEVFGFETHQGRRVLLPHKRLSTFPNRCSCNLMSHLLNTYTYHLLISFKLRKSCKAHIINTIFQKRKLKPKEARSPACFRS